jgi:hypothetical protein
VFGALLFGTMAAFAHTPPAAAPPAASAAPAPAAPAPATSAPAPSGSAASAEAPKRPATGYGYSDAKPARAAAPARARAVHHVSGPVATLPGFEMLSDGGSRLFVQLSQQVEVAEKKGSTQPPRKAKGKPAAGGGAHPTITYVLKGAHVLRRNNQNALVTVHFNTPVMRARLVPAGRDVRFVVDLRADATPAWKMVQAKDNTAILQIDFPKGEFLNGAAPPPLEPEAVAPDAPSDTDTQETR